MNTYEATVKDTSNLKQETLYVNSPNFAAVEKVLMKERKYHKIIKIEMIGVGFTYSSLYEEQKAGKR